MKKVHLSEEAIYLELFDGMLKEHKRIGNLQMEIWPQRRQAWEEVYKLSFNKENLIKRLIKYTLSKKNWSNSNKKFYVLGLRYKEILTSLPRAETLLVTSNIREVLFSIFRGYDWIYLRQPGVLQMRSFFETDAHELFSLFKKVILFLKNSNEKKFILSTSDTDPLPTLFRWASKLNKEINHTVCFQHGVYVKGDFTEGNLVDFVLSFTSSQVNYAKKIFDTPYDVIEFGPPWSVPVVEDRASCEVILVSGGGWGQENELHLKTLDILIEVAHLLDKQNIDYSFRPHPIDILEGENENFKRINSEPKKKILSGNPKIFIGFVSTLLLDAYCCGHTIIQINNEMQKDKLILESDFVILEKDLNLIPQIIEDNIILKKRNRDIPSNNLDLRLRDAFNHIEMKLLEKNNE